MQEASRLIISIHIPKTAGLSLAKFFEELYGPDDVRFFYANRFFKKPERGSAEEIEVKKAPAVYLLRKALLRSAAGRLLARRLSRFLISAPPLLTAFPPNSRVVHGHFRIKPQDRDSYKLVTVLRDPLARAISLYNYLIEESAKGNGTSAWFSKSMSFEEVVSLPQNTNVYPRYLNGLTLNDFSAVGVTEELPSYCSLFDPSGAIKLRRINSSRKVDLNLSAGFIRRFKKMNSHDYRLYEAARKWKMSPRGSIVGR